MKDRIFDVLGLVFRGCDMAVVLAWFAFAVKLGGWHVAPCVFLPLFCAFSLGEERGWKRHQRIMDEALGREPE